ncbi:MAG: nucleotidyltransferase family protein [Pseudomonadota bacterium]
MKAFLLAAGQGTRLHPYTADCPKCLIPIHGRPLMAYWFDLFRRHGVSEVLVNTHHHAQQVAAFLEASRPHYGFDIHSVFEPTLLGSGGTVVANRSFVEGGGPFFIVYADNLSGVDLTAMRHAHQRGEALGAVLTMGLFRAPVPEAAGIAEMDDQGRIVRFTEKPAQPVGNLANAGIYVATDAVIETACRVQARMPAAVLDFGHHVLPELVGRMVGCTIDTYHRDIGTIDAYLSALKEWSDNQGGIT